MGVQVGVLLRQAALRAPDAVGVIDVGHVEQAVRERSYAQLDHAARAAAAQLIALGVKPGDRVGLLAESSIELVVAWFGIVYAGAAVVPLTVLSVAPEVAFRLTHAGCVLLVHDAARSELAAAALSHAQSPAQRVDIVALADTQRAPLRVPLDTSPSDIAMVLYTSGTTGKAKGAAITHASLLLHTTALVHHCLSLSEQDTVLCVLPLSHSYGCRMGLLAPLFAGARIVVAPRFEAARTLALMHAHAVTWVPAVPTMFAAWSQLPAPLPPPALRWALSAGAPLPDELARRAEACLGAEVRQGYGMTEATFTALNAPPDARVLGSVGKPTWGIEVRVVDAQGRDVPQGETGELLVRGHNVMSHYLFDPEATQAAQADGYLHSGDIGRLDAHGRLTLVDRVKDLVIRGGYNVYPSEVEDVLAAHPSVAEVAVIGRPDAFYGEEVVAVIVPVGAAQNPQDPQDPQRTQDLEALCAFASERLSRTKLPRQYAFVSALPLGSSGKVQKRVLREWLRDGKLAVRDAVGQGGGS